MQAVFKNYFSELNHEVGAGWNRFWYQPSDALPLCLLRILVGLAALFYVGSFSGDMVTWFGPAGLIPAETVFLLSPGDVVTSFRLSYFYFLSSPVELWIVHIAGLVVVLLFTAGMFSRVTCVLSLIVVLSYVNRAPMITGHVEPLLAMMLAYLCFAPTGAFLSLDAWWKNRQTAGDSANRFRDEPLLSIGATVSRRLIQVHLAAFCLMMGLTKLAGETWWTGEAMWVLMAQADSRLVDWTSLRGAAYFINAWTHAVVLVELAFPVLIWNRLARPLILTAAALVWLPLMLITGLVSFYVMLLVGCVSFVPAPTIRTLLRMKPVTT